MRSSFYIRADIAPAIGDIREAVPGSTVYLFPDAPARSDWPRYLDAIAAAISRGADVRWVRGTEGVNHLD